jgi:hypothetical protein
MRVQKLLILRTRSHYLRSFESLTSKYGEDTDFDLKPAQIIEIIKTGDSFLREDSVDFATSYLKSSQEKLWNTPLDGSLTEILDQCAVVDPIRLRVARMLLLWYYEQLHSNPELLKRCSRGRDTASIATDILLQEISTRKLNMIREIGSDAECNCRNISKKARDGV